MYKLCICVRRFRTLQIKGIHHKPLVGKHEGRPVLELLSVNNCNSMTHVS